MTAKDVIEKLDNLPARELAKVSDYCASLMEKSKIGRAPVNENLSDPVEELIDVLGKIEIDSSSVEGDTRLAYLMEKHGAK